MNRRALFLLLSLGIWTYPLSLSAAEVVRVWPGYRTADSFETIGEFFGREESTGGRTVLRSKPDERTGFYFLTRLRKAEAALGATVYLDVIFPDTHLARRFTFPFDLKKGQSVLNVGLTGSDWPGERVRPLAWRLSVQKADGTPLASSESFLWAQP